MTVDPVQDDIEIVNEGEGTDAFAVSIYTLILKSLPHNYCRGTLSLASNNCLYFYLCI